MLDDFNKLLCSHYCLQLLLCYYRRSAEKIRLQSTTAVSFYHPLIVGSVITDTARSSVISILIFHAFCLAMAILYIFLPDVLMSLAIHKNMQGVEVGLWADGRGERYSPVRVSGCRIGT